MGLESGNYISDLVVTNPTSTDKRRQGDDHFRLIKNVLKNTLPNASAAINPSVAEFNYLVGVTSLVQTQLDAKFAIADVPALAGAGLTEAAEVLAVGAGLGIVINADDVQIEISALAAIEGNALDVSDDGYLVDDNGVPKRMSFTDDGLLIVRDDTSARTLATVDMNTYVECNDASAFAVTLNTGVGKKGNIVVLEQLGVGQVTVAGTATLNNANGLKTATRYSTLALVCKGSSVWTVIGDATP